MRRKAVWLARRWLAAWSAEKRQQKAEAKARAQAKTDAEKMAEDVLDKVARIETKSHLGLLVVSSAIFLLGYKGLTTSIGEGGLSFFAKGEAAVVAFAIAVIAQLGWAYLFKIVPVLKGRFLAAALIAATLFLGAIIAIDARFNMLAMAGDSAVQMDFVGTNSAYEERVRFVFAQASAARQLLPAIRTQASRFREAEIAERSGAYTGSPRPGAVSASYGAVGRQLGDLAKDIEIGLSEIDQLEAEAAALLSKMKGEVFGAGPVEYASVPDLLAGKETARWCYVIVGGRSGFPRQVELGRQVGTAAPVYSDLRRGADDALANDLSVNALSSIARSHCRFAGRMA